jgi:hypothetical protein
MKVDPDSDCHTESQQVHYVSKTGIVLKYDHGMSQDVSCGSSVFDRLLPGCKSGALMT